LRLKKKSSNGDETYSVYLKNMDSFEYVYVNFVFYILNYKDYVIFEAKGIIYIIIYLYMNIFINNIIIIFIEYITKHY